MSLLPPAVLESHVGIMGKTGSGKSNLAKVLAEGLLDAGERVCVIDPTGTWYGLRMTPARKPSKYGVVIFGGEHADLPIGRTHGIAIAETIGTSATPAIIDTRRMTVGERTQFVADFAETLLQRNRGPLHLIVDEAHLFAPQGRVADPASGRMLHAANNLVSLGRGVGLRIILISQRPAKLHKDSLTQIETLITMRLIAPQDRGAIEDWIRQVADPAESRDLLGSLASLPTGEGWIWAPELGLLERRRFPLASTLDTGKPSEKDVELASIDIAAVAERLAVVGADLAANDPKALRKRIAELEGQISAIPTESVEKIVEKIVEKPVLNGQADKLADVVDRLEVVATGIREIGTEIVSALRTVTTQIAERPKATISIAGGPPKPAHVATLARPPLVDGDVRIGKAESAFLAALAQYPNGLTRAQLALLTGYRVTSGHISNTLSSLRQKGLIEGVMALGERIQISPAGRAAAPDVDPLPKPGPELVAYYLATLGKAEAAFLKTIVDAYPDEISGAEIAERNGYRSTSGHISNTLSTLRIRGLIEGPSSGVRASRELVG